MKKKLKDALFSLITAMEASAHPNSSLSTSEQQVDEAMTQLQPFQKLAIPEQDMICEFVHESIVRKGGIFIQFINGNAVGASSMIGGIRLGLADIRKAPAYLSRHKSAIKQHGINMLHKHFVDTQCAMGAGELIPQEEYGLSFSLASVSRMAITLNPSRRTEGPLFYCLFDGLVEPTALSESNWQEGKVAEVAYFINAYLHLLPPSQRRIRVLNKTKTDDTPKDDDNSSRFSKKPRVWNNGEPSKQDNWRAYCDRKMLEEFENMKKKMALLEGQSLPTPPLPKSKGVVWPPKDPNQGPDLPDEL